MDEIFITRILDIVDPKRELSPQLVIQLVEEKFTSTNKQSTPVIHHTCMDYRDMQGVCTVCGSFGGR